MRMRLDTINSVYEDLTTAPFIEKSFTTVWHAGEPLIAGIDFYSDALRSSNRLTARGCIVDHAIQTNGILLNEGWCDFFKEANFRIGVSLDGPAEIHDRNRRDLGGQGTYAKTMRGISLLRRYGIEFTVICVLTRYSLDFPDRLFAFFASLGAQQLAFNIDEVEGVNAVSSMNCAGSTDAFRRFMVRMQELAAKEGLTIREFDSLRRYIYSGMPDTRNNVQVLPFGILNVDVEGNYSTFSPELLKMQHANYGDFNFGNIRK